VLQEIKPKREEYERPTAQEEEGSVDKSLEEERETRNSHKKLRPPWSQQKHMVASRIACIFLDVHPYLKEWMKINIHIERCMCSGGVCWLRGS